MNSIEQRLDRLAEQVECVASTMATQSDLEGMATKSDLEGMATKSDLEGMATDLEALGARVSREFFEARREMADTRMRLMDFREENHREHMELYRILREEMYEVLPGVR